MADVTLDQALPVVRNLAGRKANAFVRRCRFAIDEREDVESQLVLTFITRWPKFDGERASVQTFASRLMDKELTSILRYRLAHRAANRANSRCRMPARRRRQFTSSALISNAPWLRCLRLFAKQHPLCPGSPLLMPRAWSGVPGR